MKTPVMRNGLCKQLPFVHIYKGHVRTLCLGMWQEGGVAVACIHTAMNHGTRERASGFPAKALCWEVSSTRGLIPTSLCLVCSGKESTSLEICRCDQYTVASLHWAQTCSAVRTIVCHDNEGNTSI